MIALRYAICYNQLLIISLLKQQLQQVRIKTLHTGPVPAYPSKQPPAAHANRNQSSGVRGTRQINDRPRECNRCKLAGVKRTPSIARKRANNVRIGGTSLGGISQPLTTLLKKNAFKWNVAAELAYNQLKKAMMEAPVLVALPNFDQEFVVETYASGTGIGVVLCQSGHPIAHINKTLVAKHQSLSTYKKEFLAVVAALEKWKVTRVDYEICYKKGNENVVADALSRVNQSGELLQLAESSVASYVWEKVKDSWKNDIDAQNLIQSLVDHSYKGNMYNWIDAIGGHSGVYVTTKKLSAVFYWKGLKKMVKQWVRDCDICQRQKPDLSAYPGLI
ncbi:putative mitochondrial protein [Tanacetum coccineum]